MAAAVPLANGVRLAAIGTGVLRNEAAVKAISREGNPRHDTREERKRRNPKGLPGPCGRGY